MNEGKLILVLGGSRSGKSQFAERLAATLGNKVLYLATAAVYDEEMARRVQIHRQRRPAQWDSREETLNVIQAVEESAGRCDALILDCLTLWLTNLLLDDTLPRPHTPWPDKEKYMLGLVSQLANACKNTSPSVIVVSNEVGLGLVPEYPLGRAFRDVAGAANQIMAQWADEVYFVAAGLPMALKSQACQI
ncbi:MAG: bifunctional adenosylcobinamide kinase/adenosylcobinamide-phosphate guanylyltransferase [Bacillota bacterium]